MTETPRPEPIFERDVDRDLWIAKNRLAELRSSPDADRRDIFIAEFDLEQKRQRAGLPDTGEVQETQ